MTPIASFAVPAAHPVFAGHFPGYPVVPGALLLALTERHVSRWLREGAAGTCVAGVATVKFKRPVRPDERCTLLCAAPAGAALRFRVDVGEAVCVLGTLHLAETRR